MILIVSFLVLYFLILNQAQRARIKECVSGVFDGVLNLIEDTTDDISGKKSKVSRNNKNQGE